MGDSFVTVTEAAKRLGISGRRVRQLIYDGTLPARQISRMWIIRERDLERVTVYGKSGRPPKQAED